MPSRCRTRLNRHRSSRSSLCAKDEPRSHGRVDDFVTELVSGEVEESISRAMARYQVTRIDLLQVRDYLSRIIVVQWWNDVKTADNRMDLLEPRRSLRLPNRIDDAAMAAGGKNYQAPAFDDEV